MKKTIQISLLVLSLFLLYSCKKDKVPTVITSEVTNILATSATGGGTITDEGSGTIVERGICWSKAITPTIADNKTIDGGGAGTFISNLTNLDGATLYYVRAYAKNSAGIGYGMAMSFTTLGSTPLVTVLPATNITAATATFNGSVNANYLSTNVTFEYGPTINYGQSITFTGNPLGGNLNTSISADISELNPGTTYHFRIKAENSLGSTYSEDMSFATLGQVPTAITQAACCLSTTGAKFNGTVNANFLSTTVTFEYGTTTSYGNSVSATQSPVTGISPISVSANISGLNSGVTYHFRVKAENSLGTTYGDDLSFLTIPIDYDGNVYHYVKIGAQIWLVENLKTTKYSNGDLIGTTVPATLDISGENVPEYQWAYDGNESYVAIYGRLYTWSVVTDNRKICPTGWHVPSDDEWTMLTTYLGGIYVAGGKMKETGTIHWISPNLGATNESGFTALPGGYRSDDGSFTSIGGDGHWWSSTGTWYRYIWSNSVHINADYSTNSFAFSVRCLKDN